jgi:glycylpeptide N-tetradecanoyltransferase
MLPSKLKHHKITSLPKTNAIKAEPGAGDESTSASDTDIPAAAASESGPGPSRPSKKKKKEAIKSRARAVDAPKGDSVPQAVVDQVAAKVKEEHGEDHAAADEETIRKLLRKLEPRDVAEGKAGLGGKNKKDTGDHKVRRTTPQRSGTDEIRWRSSG